MPAGRPSDYSMELTNEICRQLAEGKSMAEICAKPEMPHVSNIYRWLRRHQDFRERYVLAREQQAHTVADRAIAMALGGTTIITDPQVAKVQLDAIKWTAARLAPKVYGHRADVAIGGNLDQPLTHVIRWER
jgi:transposase-like protein